MATFAAKLYIRQCIVLLVGALTSYSLIRILFIVFNYKLLNEPHVGDILLSLLHGLRFDTSAVFTISVPFLLIVIVDIIRNSSIFFHPFIINLWFIVHIFFIFINLVDVFWYPYTLKHNGLQIFYLLFTGDNILNIIKGFMEDYIIHSIIFSVIIYFLRKILIKYIKRENSFYPIYKKISIVATIIILTIIGIRGGFQLRPITNASASVQGVPRMSHVILNSTFTSIQSLLLPDIIEYNYFPENQAKKIFSQQHYGNDSLALINFDQSLPNIVLIILEGISAEYTGLNKKGISYTPCLDSLTQIGLNFTRCYANSKQSIEGIPAILSSIPGLSDEPFITSKYSDGMVESIPFILKGKNYYSIFAHGGEKGTMDFDKFAIKAGFDSYISMDEFPDKKQHYDGYWGIYDDPFLSFIYEKSTKWRRPYFLTIFTLSSHQPYILPPYINYNQISEKNLKAVHYTDASIRNFIQKYQSNPELRNTIFIITSDHTGLPLKNKFDQRADSYHIPLIAFGNGIQHRTISSVTSQVDIMPLLCGNIKTPFQSFGQNPLNPRYLPFSVNHVNQSWQLIHDSSRIEFNGTKVYFEENPYSKINTGEGFLKSYIQQYNFSLIHRKLKQ